jgi:hypothetical protein
MATASSSAFRTPVLETGKLSRPGSPQQPSYAPEKELLTAANGARQKFLFTGVFKCSLGFFPV